MFEPSTTIRGHGKCSVFLLPPIEARHGTLRKRKFASQCRANKVADALLRLGMPRNPRAVTGRGENDNRVPTAAGVREPQNRRVEIVF